MFVFSQFAVYVGYGPAVYGAERRSARSADRKAITRANCRRLACATHPESVPYVFLIGAAWQIAARTRATARGVATQDMIALVWIGLGARRAAGRTELATLSSQM